MADTPPAIGQQWKQLVSDWRAPWTRPLLKLRQWWRGRQHDKCRRCHSWEMVDEHGSIRCRRCKLLLGGFAGGGDHMGRALAEFRAQGLDRR